MRSLTAKLTLAFLFVSVVGVALVALIVLQRTEREFDRFVLDRSQSDLIADLASYYEQEGSWDGIQRIIRIDSSGHPRGGVGAVVAPVTLADPAGVVVFSGIGLAPAQKLADSEMAYAVPVELNEETVGVVLFSDRYGRQYDLEESPEAKFLANVNQAIVFGALAGVTLALVIGVLLARAISRPVKEVTAATQLVANGNLGYQVPVRTKDELGELAESFNRMSADLARSNEQRRQMTADIAHDLRTPLSVILGYMEALSNGVLQATPETMAIIYAKGQHLQRLIDDLRTLALADAGELSLNERLVEPRSLLEHAALAHMVHAQEQGVTLHVVGEQEMAQLCVDPERIAQVLGNLINNALRHTPSNGEVALSAEQEGAQIVLRVRDTGSGIAPEDLPHVFDRFYRSDRSRRQSGESGLGLAIARSIVQAHKGEISVASEPGNGTTFTILLPIAPSR